MESSRAFLRQSLLPYIRSRAFYINVGLCVLALLLGRVELFSVILPFGIAFMAASDLSGFNHYFPLFSVLLSGVLTLPQGLVPVTGALLYAGMRLAYRMFKKKINKVDKLLMLTITQFLLLPFFYMETVQSFLQGVSGIALVMLMSIVFQNGLRALKGISVRNKLHEEEQMAICLLFGAVALSVSELSAYSFTMSFVLIAAASIFAAYTKGLPAVGVSVALCGMLILGGRAQPLLLADIAACTLCAVLCKRVYGMWGPVAGFLVCAALTERYITGAGQHIGLVNAIPASLILVLLPKRGVLWLRAAVDSNAKEEKTARGVLERIQAETAEDIIETADTVNKMAGLFPVEAKWKHDYEQEQNEIFQAVSHVCADCAHRGACWRNPNDMLLTIEELIPVYNKGVRPRTTAPMDQSCTRATSIVAAAINAQEAYRKNCAQNYYQNEQQAFAHRQLKGISKVMQSLSEDIKERAWPDENASVILRRRLEREGLPVRDALVERFGDNMRVELRIQPTVIEEAMLEEMVSRAMEKPLRLVRTQKFTRVFVLQFEQRRKLSVTTGAATKPMEGSVVSGDSTGSINLWGGKALFALSDGMGSGLAAQKQSQEAVSLLLKLYEVGFNRDEALECVNRLLVNQGQQDMYATVDALLVDLNNGEAQFIKFGAPPSFVLRDGRVHTVYAEALPAGILDEATAAINIATLRRNDVVVLLTDGALEALGEETPQEILRCVGGANSCEDAAQELLEAASMRNGADDMTVLVTRME